MATGNEHPSRFNRAFHFLKGVGLRISDDRVSAEAAGVTFYTLLSLFPAIGTIVALYGLISDPKDIAKDLLVVSGVVPGGGMQILNDQIASLIKAGHAALGLRALLGLVISIWSANSAVSALFAALNAVYETKETRGFISRTIQCLVFTVGALVFVILAMAAVVVLPAVLNFIGISQIVNFLLHVLRWPLLMGVMTLFLAFLYRFGPSGRHARWHWVTWGGFLASVFWLIASWAFSIYVENFGSYDKTYGSLGAVVGFMTWIWISVIIVLSGAEFDAALHPDAEIEPGAKAGGGEKTGAQPRAATSAASAERKERPGALPLDPAKGHAP